jgi:two-component system response regulator
MMPPPVEILLVEDNPADLELTMHVFKVHNLAHRVQVVRDGVEAIDFLFASGANGVRTAAEGPKVILLDLKLPKIDGLQVLRRIKAHERLRTVPVVMLTSSQEESDIVQSYQLGVNSYIVKPVDFDRFADAVRQLGGYWLLLNQAPVR